MEPGSDFRNYYVILRVHYGTTGPCDRGFSIWTLTGYNLPGPNRFQYCSNKRGGKGKGRKGTGKERKDWGLIERAGFKDKGN